LDSKLQRFLYLQLQSYYQSDEQEKFQRSPAYRSRQFALPHIHPLLVLFLWYIKDFALEGILDVLSKVIISQGNDFGSNLFFIMI
jgi:hypothetical protein